MQVSKNKKFITGLLFLIAAIVFSTLSHASTDDEKAFAAIVQKLIATSKEIKTKADLSPIQKLVGDELILWNRPGVVFYPQKILKRNEIKGGEISEQSITNPFYVLQSVFESGGIRQAPIIVLKSKKFDPLSPDACGDGPSKLKKWDKKWVVYPGDYLLDTSRKDAPGYEKDMPEFKKVFSNPADKTLLFLDGYANYYFGLKQIDGKWQLHSVGSDSDCDA